MIALAGAAQAVDAGQRLAFVAAVQGTATLQSWADAGGHSRPADNALFADGVR